MGGRGAVLSFRKINYIKSHRVASMSVSAYINSGLNLLFMRFICFLLPFKKTKCYIIHHFCCIPPLKRTLEGGEYGGGGEKDYRDYVGQVGGGTYSFYRGRGGRCGGAQSRETDFGRILPNARILPKNRPQIFHFIYSTGSITSCSEFGQ
jgi:hypothetical protein